MAASENQNPGSKRMKNLTPNVDLTAVGAKLGGVLKQPSFREAVLIIACFTLLIMLLHLNLRNLDLTVGQVSKMDIAAPRDVIDPEATRQAQNEAVDRALEAAKQDIEYYMVDETVNLSVSVNLNRFFETVESFRQNDVKLSQPASEIPPGRFEGFFRETPPAQLLRDIIALTPERYQEFKENARQVLSDLELNQKLTASKIETIEPILRNYFNLHQIAPELSPPLTVLVKVAIRPNLVLNTAKLDSLKRKVTTSVPPVIRHQRELLIGKNQIITQNDLDMLTDLHLVARESNRLLIFLSLSFFVLLLIGLVWIYIYQFHPGLFKQERLLYLLIMLTLLVVGLMKVMTLVDSTELPYLAPVSFVSMLIAILIEPQLAFAMTIVISLLGGVIGDYSLAITIFYFLSGVAAIFSLSHFQRQRDLVRSGFILMIVNGLTAIILNLLFRTSFTVPVVILAVINGFLSAVLAIGSIPFLEHIFKITSPIRLLELANPGNPLLRRLQIEAPGTYHHSIMVGNLAEAAAEGIGADVLWVRVGSYYHDIGKIKRPYFFVENQFAQDNPHEKLNPSLSTLIITYHVKEGAEIGREHGLPDKLIEIIEQHHGTDLVRYFYKRASESLQGEKEALIEEDFRYEGPKPQSKEAALVMLADSVEAAVKSLPKPTPAKIETVIHKIIQERLEDGQFDECNLTLKDLNLVKKSFIKVLGGLFHNRIEYPETVLKEMERKKGNADSGK